MTDAQAAASSVVTEDKLCFECSEQAPEKRSYNIGEGRCDTCGIEDGEIFAMQDGWRASLQPSSRDWLRPDATSSSRMPRGGQGTSVSSSSVASTAPARPGPQRLSLAAAVSVEVEADGRLTADASDRALPLAAQQLLQMTKVRTTPSHHGIVKRVDQHYAFVACQEIHNMYHRDVFVPAREMTGKKLSVGDRVLFSVNILTADNIQAVDLSRDDEAMTRARLGSDDAGGDLSDQRFTGSIKSFNSESGYGFVTSPETTQLYGCDVFLHGSQIKEFNIGDRVMFTVRLNNKTMKPQAYDLRAAGPANVRSWLDSSGDTGEAAATTASSPGAEPSGEQALAIGSGTSSATPAAAIASADISEERYVGDIKSFNSQKGYGFIECAELFKQFQRDVFIHMNQFEGKKIGDHVTFKIQVKKGQPQAAEVSLADVNGQPLEAPGKSTAPQGKAQAGGVTGTTAAAAAGSALGSVAAAVRRAEEAQREVEEAAAMLSSRLIRACASVRLEACDIIRDLLAAKAQPNVKDVTGQTPLMIAALNARQSERKCKLLIEYRADLESPLCAGMSAIEWAKQRLNPNFAAFLEAERIGKPLENYEVAMTAPRDDF